MIQTETQGGFGPAGHASGRLLFPLLHRKQFALHGAGDAANRPADLLLGGVHGALVLVEQRCEAGLEPLDGSLRLTSGGLLFAQAVFERLAGFELHAFAITCLFKGHT